MRVRRSCVSPTAVGRAEEVLRPRQFEATPDLATGVKRVVLLVLKSPRFLYREIDGRRDRPVRRRVADVVRPVGFAARRALLKAAAKGKLATRDQIVAQLERMLPDLRTRTKLREFFLGWLKISQPTICRKTPSVSGVYAGGRF